MSFRKQTGIRMPHSLSERSSPETGQALRRSGERSWARTAFGTKFHSQQWSGRRSTNRIRLPLGQSLPAAVLRSVSPALHIAAGLHATSLHAGQGICLLEFGKAIKNTSGWDACPYCRTRTALGGHRASFACRPSLCGTAVDTSTRGERARNSRCGGDGVSDRRRKRSGDLARRLVRYGRPHRQYFAGAPWPSRPPVRTSTAPTSSLAAAFGPCSHVYR